MTDEMSQWMQDARQALENGDVNRARRILRRIVHKDADNYRAWLWLAGVTESADASLQYVRRAEAIAPDDPTVQQALTWAKGRFENAAAPARQAVAESLRAEKALHVDAGDDEQADDRQPLGSWLQTIGLVLLVVVAVILIALLLLQWQSGRAAAAGLPVVVARSAPEPLQDIRVPPVPAATTVADVRPVGLPAKQAIAASHPIAVWTPTPSPTPLPTATPLPASGGISFNEARWIDVDLTRQILTAYEYDVPVFTTAISSGLAGTPTVTGQFRIYLRYDSQNMSGYHLGYDYYLPNVPNVQYFHGNFALHGTYWHNNFGTPQSHGCVNLSIADSQWLYNFADVGTLVYVHY